MRILLGFLIGAIVTKLIFRRRFMRRFWGGGWGHGFGFGGGHFGPFGGGWGHGHPHFGRWGRYRGGMFARLHGLDLDPEQRDQAEAIWVDTVAKMPRGRNRFFVEAMEAASADTLDPIAVDALVERWTDLHARGARTVADAVTRFHGILRPEQRERLRSFVRDRFGAGSGGPAPSEGPYR